ncbi:MAG TPA: MFS transporter, partial [Polyangia bacterium]|nr:MFS transporter [Polyangia bacterium]
ALGAHAFPLFMAMFLVLFVSSGIGNGSTFRMIPVIFRREALRATRGQAEAVQAAAVARARRTSAAVLGFCGAIGACGGYLIPRALGASIKATGGATTALGYFVGFYATCLALTWWHYLRTTFLARAVPSLAEAEV